MRRNPLKHTIPCLLAATLLTTAVGNPATAQSADEETPKKSDSQLALAKVDGLLIGRNFDRALEVAKEAVAKSSDSFSLTALGEAELALGHFNEAGQAFFEASKAQPVAARAHSGLATLFLAERRMKNARAHALEAFKMDPEDPRVQFIAGRLSYPSELEQSDQRRPPCTLASKAKATKIDLRQFRPEPGYENRFGVEMKINGGKPIRTLLDTGASGVLISQKLAAQLGAEKLSETQFFGIGDDGPRKADRALVDEIQFGNVVYRDCVVYVLEDAAFEHGETRAIVGIDVLWKQFLVTIDVPQMRLLLSPQPPLPTNEKGEIASFDYDRDMSLAEQGWTPIRIYRGDVIVPTLLDRKVTTYLILDTGAWATVLSKRVADQLGRLRESSIKIVGISGEEENVWEIHGDTEMIMAGLSQEHRNVKVVDADRFGSGGFIGYSLLQHTEVTIDERNAMIKIVPGKIKRKPSKSRPGSGG